MKPLVIETIATGGLGRPQVATVAELGESISKFSAEVNELNKLIALAEAKVNGPVAPVRRNSIPSTWESCIQDIPEMGCRYFYFNSMGTNSTHTVKF